MNNFDKFIKEKVEQFDVPYNDAHWLEMESKLNAISRVSKLKRNLGIAAGVIGVATTSYFLIDFSDDTIDQTSENNIEINETNSPIEKDHINFPNDNKNTVTSNENNSTEESDNNSVVENIENVNNEELINNGENNSDNNLTPENIEENLAVESNENNTATNDSEFAKPKVEFVIVNNNICLGETVSFKAIESDLPLSYMWYFGDGLTSSKTNPSHVYLESGVFNVTLIVTNKLNGKEYIRTEKNAVSVAPSPSTTFTWKEMASKHGDNKLKYPHTEFTVKGNEKSSYSWKFSNGETAKTKNPAIIFKKKGVYQAELEAKNDFGCTSTSSQTIVIDNGFDLLAPTAFTPNGNGNNDNFIPKALEYWDVQFEMLIKDKIGNTVYKTSDYHEPWNGRLNNSGSMMDEGIYIWQVITYDYRGKPHSHYGTINLIK